MFGNDAIVFKRRAGGGSLLRERLTAGEFSGIGESRAIATALDVDLAVKSKKSTRRMQDL
jgi:hypothetical protein